MASAGHFGVVQIERGSEVGRGDVRLSVGTIARVYEPRCIASGRWLVLALGTNRLGIERWLSEEPYPRAEVRAFPGVAGRVAGDLEWAVLSGRMRRVLSDLDEFGDAVTPETFELGDDPTLWSFRLADLGPFAELDRQRLLAAPTVSERNALLGELIDEVNVTNKMRLKIDEEAGEGGG